MLAENRSISSTEVITVAYGNQNWGADNEKALAGIKAHQSIAHEAALRVTRALPGFGSNFPLNETGQVVTERFVKKQISPELMLTAKLDLVVNGDLVIEVKPTPRKTHFVQLALNYMASDRNGSGHAVLYFYAAEKPLYILKDNGSQHEADLICLCQMAHKLLENERRIEVLERRKKQRKRSVKNQYTLPGVFWGREEPDEIPAISNESIQIRREFDPLFSAVALSLTQSASRIKG